MDHDRFQLGAQVGFEEVVSFRSKDRKTGKHVFVHILPEAAERKQSWLDRVEMKVANCKAHGIVDMTEWRGKQVIVTGEVPNWPGFARWVDAFDNAPAGGAAAEVLKLAVCQFMAARNAAQARATPPAKPGAEVDEFFQAPVHATHILSYQQERKTAAPQPQSASPQMSEYTRVVLGQQAQSAPTPVVAPQPQPVAPPDTQLEIKRLEGLVELWRMAAVGGFALVLLLIVVIILK